MNYCHTVGNGFVSSLVYFLLTSVTFLPNKSVGNRISNLSVTKVLTLFFFPLIKFIWSINDVDTWTSYWVLARSAESTSALVYLNARTISFKFNLLSIQFTCASLYPNRSIKGFVFNTTSRALSTDILAKDFPIFLYEIRTSLELKTSLSKT